MRSPAPSVAGSDRADLRGGDRLRGCWVFFSGTAIRAPCFCVEFRSGAGRACSAVRRPGPPPRTDSRVPGHDCAHYGGGKTAPGICPRTPRGAAGHRGRPRTSRCPGARSGVGHATAPAPRRFSPADQPRCVTNLIRVHGTTSFRVLTERFLGDVTPRSGSSDFAADAPLRGKSGDCRIPPLRRTRARPLLDRAVGSGVRRGRCASRVRGPLRAHAGQHCRAVR
ncbi:hypothetical protein FHR84_002250 [Actinopolyspora biskrensis]|uniref:Uncharacterized protein n=1 Tax=Actinopolyspora biskrensis TaxID=1470178 RepID=A0A852Z0Y2_9ACTN|nr:hypothetical protein [Actinopolyspora biskrensis]